MKFQWTADQSVFVPEVDAEHRDIVRMAGELQKAIFAGGGNARVESLLKEMIEHIAGHFAHEERLMQSTRYSSYAWHKRQHDAAAAKVTEFAGRIHAADPKAPLEMLAYLHHWLRDHISVSDQMLGAFLRNSRRALVA